jgi:hypothetical protein
MSLPPPRVSASGLVASGITSVTAMSNISFVDVFVRDASVDSMFTELTRRLASVNNVHPTRINENTLVIHHRHVPDWAKILGVIGALFFLIGLVFFLVKTTETATVYGREVEGGASFTVTGVTSADAYRVVNVALHTPGRSRAERKVGDPTSPERDSRGAAAVPRAEETGEANYARSTTVELERLAALHASGALDDDEFRRAKRKLLDE